jgi:hypothetical protein
MRRTKCRCIRFSSTPSAACSFPALSSDRKSAETGIRTQSAASKAFSVSTPSVGQQSIKINLSDAANSLSMPSLRRLEIAVFAPCRASILDNSIEAGTICAPDFCVTVSFLSGCASVKKA